MLLPKRVKYRRVQRGRMTGKATRGNVVCQGQYGLVALEPAWISSTQIEAARVAMTRYIKRGGKVWIKIFPDKPVTEKPAETRMGSGKGSPESVSYTHLNGGGGGEAAHGLSGAGSPCERGCPGPLYLSII